MRSDGGAALDATFEDLCDKQLIDRAAAWDQSGKLVYEFVPIEGLGQQGAGVLATLSGSIPLGPVRQREASFEVQTTADVDMRDGEPDVSDSRGPRARVMGFRHGRFQPQGSCIAMLASTTGIGFSIRYISKVFKGQLLDVYGLCMPASHVSQLCSLSGYD